MVQVATVYGSHSQNVGSALEIAEPISDAPWINKVIAFYGDARKVDYWLRSELPSGTYRQLALRIMRDLADDLFMGDDESQQAQEIHDLADKLAKIV